MISDELDALNRPQPERDPEGFDAGDNGQVDVADVANVDNVADNAPINNLDQPVLAERASSHLIVMTVAAVHPVSEGQTQLNSIYLFETPRKCCPTLP